MKFVFTASLFCYLLSASFNVTSQTKLSYYFPEAIELNDKIFTPKEITDYQVGDWHFSHDQILAYARSIAKESNRAQLFEYARSWENRPLVYLVFTDPENHDKLETIRKNHIQKTKYGNQSRPGITDPLVIHLGYGVHGNESSASNSSLLTMYYLAASEEDWLKDFLKENIIIVDTCLNPDGFTRHASWINQNRSQNLVSDPASRGFNEPWPGGRMNHYWFDLNRDYIPLTHPETEGRIELFHKWLPHVLTDHHEMGANSTFFFQPGVKSRNNPIVPEKNYTLTRKIAEFHAETLDEAGVRYFTEERFDDYYFGKGSSYPDAHGSIGILFEQAGYRGHLRETEHGLRSFPYAVKNHFRVSLSTLRAATALNEELKHYQKDFFRKSVENGKKSQVQAYIFSEKYDHTRLNNFIDLLNKHQILIRKINKNYTLNGQVYEKDHSFIIETSQEQYHLILSFFDPIDEFKDSTFYDVSTWTLPYSYNINYDEIRNRRDLSNIRGEIVNSYLPAKPALTGNGNYALVMEWDDYNSPAALYTLLNNDLNIYVATKPFSMEGKKFNFGSIIIPIHDQSLKPDDLLQMADKVSSRYNVSFYRLNTGLSDMGINLGSGRMERLKKPEVAIVTGEGSHAYTSGEMWHLMDINYGMPVTLLDGNRMESVDLDRYTTLCISGWNLDIINEKGHEKLKTWLDQGGTLISIVYPLWWLNENNFTNIEFVPEAEPDPTGFNYADRYKVNDIHRIAGSIFKINADLSHPLFYGYRNPEIPVFKNRATVIKENGSAFAFPAKYTESPLLSGYSSDENVERIANSPYVMVHRSGNGRIIHFVDNPNFRGLWHGTNKIFANAIFFGGLL